MYTETVMSLICINFCLYFLQITGSIFLKKVKIIRTSQVCIDKLFGYETITRSTLEDVRTDFVFVFQFVLSGLVRISSY